MSTRSLFGARIKRKEDGRLVAGRGRYLDDLRLPDLLHVAIVRSPHAHADVTHIDATAARAIDGVVAVLTRAQLPELSGSVPPLVSEPKHRPYQHPVLAAERVRHVGEAVAVVVARDPYVAVDGAAAVVVQYQPLEAVTRVATALSGRFPPVNHPIRFAVPASVLTRYGLMQMSGLTIFVFH